MRTWKHVVVLTSLVVSACDEPESRRLLDGSSNVIGIDPGDAATEEDTSVGDAPDSGPGIVTPPDMERDSGTVDDAPDASVEPLADAGGEPDAGEQPDASQPDAGPPPAPWYACQSSDQAFVRSALMAVLGRRPFSQSEVNVYSDFLREVDAADGVAPNTPNRPGSELRHSRKVLLSALFKNPQYNVFWEDLYRDFIRVQRVDEQFIPGCWGTPMNEDPSAVAAFVRDQPASSTGDGNEAFTMYDVVQGAIAIDDVTPIYLANIFAMLTETYAGANAEPVALELTRRRDFGAWFDAVYLQRDTVCLNCHNSEFSVTQTANPATNRHFPVPALLEKSLFGLSTGPATFGGYEGADRMHAPLKYKGFVNDCVASTQTPAQANITCASPTEKVYRCLNERICESAYLKRGFTRPWGWDMACGRYAAPNAVAVDIASVEAKFGNVTGLRTSAWDLNRSLQAGFAKLAAEGLGVSAQGDVADPDKAFAYLTSMSIVEKAWLQIVGTPLTIPTRFPRNAASRDQLQHLAETFIASGFSNKKLIETILASPYANVARPEDGCGEAYAMPAVFDPWVTAEDEPARRKNGAGDAVVSLTGRTASSAIYAALGWTPASYAMFPDTSRLGRTSPLLPAVTAERAFQSETGIYHKNAEPGFRGFDFQARLGWENRFGVCAKLSGATAPDFIDELVGLVAQPGRGTLADLIAALKDRLLGRASIDGVAEKPALEALLGAPLSTDAAAVPDVNTSLRKVCGVIASSPQFMLNGLPPKDTESVPKLTPSSARYAAVCDQFALALSGAITVTCNDGYGLSVNISEPN